MDAALRITTRVLPGHRVEVTAPELREGQTVDVILMPNTGKREHKGAIEIIEGLRGHRLFATPQEVDHHLREERNSWDR